MHTKKTLVANQKLIDDVIAKIPVTYEPSGNDLDSSQYAYIKSCMTFSKLDLPQKPHLRDYTYAIDRLLQAAKDINYTNKKLVQQLHLEILRLLADFIKKAIPMIKIDSSQQKNINEMHEYQVEMEQILKKHFAPTFSLPRSISLSNVFKDYNKAYEEAYGQGCLGFFRLPVKRFFQQKSRVDELQFLTDVDIYCFRHQTESEGFRNSLKLSAANLLSAKIATETYGNGSILGRILEKRIDESELPNDGKDIMADFVNQCEKRKIKVPEHLKEFYKARGESQESSQLPNSGSGT